jgi:hypothetical protein
MTRYFFHLHADSFVEDEEGIELADLASAREHALEGARDMVCADIRQGWLNLDHSIEITDGKIQLMRLSFREAFEIRS